MITDKLSNAHLYYRCHPGFKEAFEFLIKNTGLSLPEKSEIDGNKVYAMPKKCTLRKEGSGSFEAHKRYIDIQYIVKSCESFQYTHVDLLTPLTAYDEGIDAQRFSGQGSVITLQEGDFIVFFPDDAHLACISLDEATTTSDKILVKVLA